MRIQQKKKKKTPQRKCIEHRTHSDTQKSAYKAPTAASNGWARCCCFSHSQLSSKLHCEQCEAKNVKNIIQNRQNVLRIYVGMGLDPWDSAKAKRRNSIESHSLETIHQLNLSHLFSGIRFDFFSCVLCVQECGNNSGFTRMALRLSHTRVGKMRREKNKTESEYYHVKSRYKRKITIRVVAHGFHRLDGYLPLILQLLIAMAYI